MPRRMRLDAELVRRKLARSRAEASALIADGLITVDGLPALKSSTAVGPEAAVVVHAVESRWVSRGALKLLGALDALPELTVENRQCLDAGASTGGFTQVLLSRGAASVAAVDVGYGQLAWVLRTDGRVRVIERVNVRTLTPEAIAGPVELTTADLSFISLRTVLPALRACTTPQGDLLVLVKPQFEVGRRAVGRGGVVRDPTLRCEAVLGVAAAAGELGLSSVAVVASGLPGPAGNVEYFVWLRADRAEQDRPPGDGLVAMVRGAVESGPQ